MIIPLYSTLIRPYLKYCFQFYFPEFKQTQGLERIYRRATKIIKGLENLPYQSGNTEGVRSFLCGEEKTQGGPQHSIPVIMGGCKEDRATWKGQGTMGVNYVRRVFTLV